MIRMRLIIETTNFVRALALALARVCGYKRRDNEEREWGKR